MSSFHVSFMGDSGFLSGWTIRSCDDLKEAVDYVYDVIVMCSEDEYLKTDKGAVKVGKITHWTVIED